MIELCGSKCGVVLPVKSVISFLRVGLTVALVVCLSGCETREITARRFDKVYGDASQGSGYDKAKAWETPRDNHVDAADNWAQFWSQKSEMEMVYDILAFEFVKIRASTGGNDTALVTKSLDFDLLLEDGWLLLEDG